MNLNNYPYTFGACGYLLNATKQSYCPLVNIECSVKQFTPAMEICNSSANSDGSEHRSLFSIGYFFSIQPQTILFDNAPNSAISIHV